MGETSMLTAYRIKDYANSPIVWDTMSRASRPYRLYGLPIGLMVISLILFWFTGWIADDAMITLRSVMNFTHGYGPVHHMNERVQSFTHTSWFFILSAITFIVKNPYWAIIIASLAVNATTIALILTRMRYFLLVLLALFLSRAFVDFANSGLENPLSFLLISVLILSHYEKLNLPFNNRVFGESLILGLLILTRPDFGLFLLVYAGFFVRRHNIKPFLYGLFPLMLWVGFSVFYYGTPIPNSALAKIGLDIPKTEVFVQSIQYFNYNLTHDPLTVIVLVWFVIFGLSVEKLRWLAITVGLYWIYLFSIGGDFMAGRFLSVPYFAAIMAGSIVLEKLTIKRWHLALLSLSLLVLGHKGLQYGFYDQKSVIDNPSQWVDPQTGIADERRYYFGRYSWHNPDFPPLPDWTELTRTEYPKNTIVICGGLGERGLTLGPNTHLLDRCGLSDPLLARLPYYYSDHHIFRPGHFIRQFPTGYMSIIAGETDQVQEPYAATLYNDVVLATQAPLLSLKRIGAIFRLQLHDYGVKHLYGKGLVRYVKGSDIVKAPDLDLPHTNHNTLEITANRDVDVLGLDIRSDAALTITTYINDGWVLKKRTLTPQDITGEPVTMTFDRTISLDRIIIETTEPDQGFEVRSLQLL